MIPLSLPRRIQPGGRTAWSELLHSPNLDLGWPGNQCECCNAEFDEFALRDEPATRHSLCLDCFHFLESVDAR